MGIIFTVLNLVKNFISGNKMLSLIIVLLILLGSLFTKYEITKSKLDKQIDRNEILYNTISSVKDTVTTYQIRMNDSTKLWVGKIKDVEMEKSSFEILCNKQAQEIARLNLKNVQQVTTISTATKDSIRVPVYIDSMKVLRAKYSDEFIDISTTIYKNNQADIQYQSRDSFTLIKNEEYKHKFLFFKWSKFINYQLLSKNPKTKITGLKVITITKK